MVIAVDKKYYESKNKELKFDYKLRHTLFRVPVGISIEQLIDSLKKITNSIFLEENQKNLEIKYNEAIGFYKDKKELMLSVTYRKGNLRYSFHPVDLIQYVAEYVLKHNGEEWRAKKLEFSHGILSGNISRPFNGVTLNVGSPAATLIVPSAFIPLVCTSLPKAKQTGF